jgi:hypothetical protein
MANENQNQGGQNQDGQSQDWRVAERDALDRELTAALAKFTAVEPRPGLEDRVLAHVRSERERIPDRSWWSVVSAAVAVAAVIIVTVTLVLRAGRPHAPEIANHSPAPVPTPAAERPAPQVASNNSPNAAHPQPRQRTAVRHGSRREAVSVSVAPPKLDHFPSPQPLTEQELALAHYVRQFPQEATLIAQAQEEYEKEIQKAMNDARSETEGNSSDQQER